MQNEINSKMIKYPGANGKEIEAFIAEPRDAKQAPAIIVIHEIWGLDNHIKDVAERFAREGYVALAPHLFSSGAVPPEMTPENIKSTMKFFMSIPPEKQRDTEYAKQKLAEIKDETTRSAVSTLMPKIFNLPRDKLTAELEKAVEYLGTLSEVKKGEVGSVGFCFGGGMSALLACTGRTKASIIFYGESPPSEAVKGIKGAVMGLYGGKDRRINATLKDLVEAMAENEKDFQMKIFPGAPHAFFNDTNPVNYNESAAREAWPMVLDFFRRKLSS